MCAKHNNRGHANGASWCWSFKTPKLYLQQNLNQRLCLVWAMLKNFPVNIEQDKVIVKSKHFPVPHTQWSKDLVIFKAHDCAPDDG